MTCALMRLSRGENSAELPHPDWRDPILRRVQQKIDSRLWHTSRHPCWPEAPSNRTTIVYYGIDHRLDHCRYS